MGGIAFVVATFALSKVFEASRLLTGGMSSSWTMQSFFVWFAVMLLSLAVLAFHSYKKALGKGEVVHRIRLFDMLLASSKQEHQP